ncbi:MAG: GNAT family N-acetyltransferase, partial [Ilumatobacteraceae bacterium]
AHPYWPLFDLEVRTPRLTLRYIDDELAAELTALAERGVHDPATMPFVIPWTDLEPPEFGYSSMQFHWRNRAELSPAAWTIGFATIVEGTVVGTTDLLAKDFPKLRRFETGSWLGLEYQGRGIGKEMRLATLTFGFDALGAVEATTGAWADNEASLGVTKSLGYEYTGTGRKLRRGEPDVHLDYRMGREHFAGLRRDDIEVIGAESVRSQLGLGSLS